MGQTISKIEKKQVKKIEKLNAKFEKKKTKKLDKAEKKLSKARAKYDQILGVTVEEPKKKDAPKKTTVKKVPKATKKTEVKDADVEKKSDEDI